MADKTRHLNDQVAAARAQAEAHLPALEQAYTTLLRKAGRGAAENFRNLTVTAAANPEQWQPPNQNLVAGDQLETDAVNQIPPLHRRMLDDATPAEALGISFTLNQPAPQVLLAKLSKRLGTLGDAIRQQVDEAVAQGYQEGWSVARTADEIIAKTDMIAPVRAEALARTDLNALSNGTSLSLASQIDGVSTKTWLATEDDRTRETHQDADGQTVPIDQPFDVGGEQAQYPGDPDLSDGESFNCRCTVSYGDNTTASAEGGDMSTTVDHATVPPESDMSVEAVQLAALRELVPGLADVEDRTLLALHTLVLAARKQHAYRGDGGLCVLCDQPASDGAAHFAALAASVTEFTLVAAANPGEPTRWVAPALLVENQPTEDGRVMLPGSITWRDMPLPLGLMLETMHSDLSDAPICGGIDSIVRVGDVLTAAGFFNDNLNDPDLRATALQAIEVIRNGSVRGISADVVPVGGMSDVFWPDIDETMDTAGEEELPPELGDEMEPITDVEPDDDVDDLLEMPAGRFLRAVTEGVILGACVVPSPAIANAQMIAITASGVGWEMLRVTNPLFDDCGCGDLAVPVSLVAAAAPLAPPREWFEVPELDVPTPLTVTDDGRVFGHIALWNSCHEGFAGRCVPPPRQSDGFRKFHNGDFKTADGSRIPVGKLTLKAGHASIRVSEEAARAHYDNTATIGAFIRASNGRHGIWVAGALKSDLQPELVRDLMASPPSGDWRGHELVAAHAVIDPGFPVLRASGFGDLLEWDDDVEMAVPVSPLTHLRPGRRTRAA